MGNMVDLVLTVEVRILRGAFAWSPICSRLTSIVRRIPKPVRLQESPISMEKSVAECSPGSFSAYFDGCETFELTADASVSG